MLKKSSKARGKFISRAVDVAEVAANDCERRSRHKNIVITPEQFTNEGREVRVSTIEITLGRSE